MKLTIMFERFYTEKGKIPKQALCSGRGQAALIVLLMSALILTIGLATAARTVTDIKISSQLEEGGRALAAAEAGIELGLKYGTDGTWEAGDGVTSASYQIRDIPGGESSYSLGTVKKGEAKTIWLVPHDAGGQPQINGPYYSGNLDINWTDSSLETIVIYKEGSDYKITRNYEEFAGSQSFDFGSGYGDGAILLRVKPISGDSQIEVSNLGGSFPSQGKKIVSSGKTISGITRKVEVTRWYPFLPGIFDYVVYSGGNLSK